MISHMMVYHVALSVNLMLLLCIYTCIEFQRLISSIAPCERVMNKEYHNYGMKYWWRSYRIYGGLFSRGEYFANFAKIALTKSLR